MKDEINLMPKQFVLRRERRLYVLRFSRLINRVFPLLILLIIAQVIILMFLSGLYGGLEETNRGQRENGYSVVAEVNNVNVFLREFKEVKESYLVWSPLIEDVLSVIPDGISLLSLEAEEETGDIIIRGASTSREGVVSFQKSLEKISWVMKVDSPLQNFALEANKEFTFTISRR